MSSWPIMMFTWPILMSSWTILILVAYIDVLVAYNDVFVAYIDVLVAYIDVLVAYNDVFVAYIDGLVIYIDILVAYIDVLQCYTERIQLGSHGVYYNMGCMDRDLCSSIDNNDIIVGKKRSAVINKLNERYAYEVNPHSFAKRDAACKECCTDALCNLPLCALPAGSATIPPSGEIYVRLLGGKTPYEGTVEVFYNGIWGAVCDDDWTPYDARVLCNMLGYTGDGARAMNGSVINSDQSKIWRDQFECRGTESSLVQCAHGAWEMRNCEQKNTAGVICSSVSPQDGAIYLLDSANHTMARINHTDVNTYIPMLGLNLVGHLTLTPSSAGYILQTRLSNRSTV
ncbi:Scavenger receptor cysteine-rich domain super protein [Bulinus truncatus]|nr:Scavenger receptor cysteine-rich domain super protein [Bulinus truncatus]